MKRIVPMAMAMFSLLNCAPSRAQSGVSMAKGADGQMVQNCMNLKSNKPIPCSDSTLYFLQGKRPVEEAYNGRQFARLDELYEQWCTGKDRFPDGLWKLSEFEGGLAANFATWKMWDRDLVTIKAWQQASPKSAAAMYAEAIYWHHYAWKARGGGYASTVSSEGWQLFRDRLAKAEAALDAPQLAGTQCPAPDTERIELMIDQGADETRLASVYTEAVRKYPEYHPLYFSMARQYQPKWGGSAAQYETFASGVAKLTKNFEGMGMYARLYWLVDYNSGLPFRNQPQTAPYWDKLRAGFDDLMRLYPSSIHNLGKYADVACRSTDGALYRTLRTKLEGYEEETHMSDPVDVCDLRHHWKAD